MTDNGRTLAQADDYEASPDTLEESENSTKPTDTLKKAGLSNQSRNLLHRLRQDLQLLSPAERQIGQYILEQPRQALRLPMDQLAKEIGISQGTLSNFCQSLGYTGFREFRLALAAEVNSPLQLEHSAIARGDNLQEIANKAISANIDALITTLNSLDMAEVEKAIEAIGQARRIELYGIGVSAAVALDAFNRFWSIGLMANWLPDISHQIASAAVLTSQDVALAFSYAGETRATVKALSLAHQHGATTIVITGSPHSALARYADIKLVVTPREPTAFRRNLRISARVAMLGIIDIIYLGLLNSLDESAFEKIEKVYRLYSGADDFLNNENAEDGQ